MGVQTGGSAPKGHDGVAALRSHLWDAGFRPVPIVSHDVTGPSPGKRPLGKDWTGDARRDPPFCTTAPAVSHALNTGILCDGLRAIDVDVDDGARAQAIQATVLRLFGETCIRFRRNSPRVLLLYRAAEGQPPKRVCAGALGKVEVLGRGQQFVAFGTHDTGAVLEWTGDGPGQCRVDELPAVTEQQIQDMLTEIAPIIEAVPPGAPRTMEGAVSGHGLGADGLQVIAALSSIPNAGPADWEAWNRIGMATWAATSGSAAGRAAWHAWSQQNPAYDAEATDERWDHYAVSPPTRIGAGTLFHLARQQGPEPAHEPAGEPADMPEEYWTALGLDAAEYPHPIEEPVHEEMPGRVLPYFTFAEASARIDVDDFVEGVLTARSMAVIYGESNSGKTFFATDLGLHIAAQRTWRERAIEGGAVIYLALEGSLGVRNRIQAWKEHHGLDGADLPFVVVPVSLNLLNPDADAAGVIATVRHIAQRFDVPVRAVFVDTLSRAMAGGNENAPEDMTALVGTGDLIRQETGAALIWIHHSGKDLARGARGHSSLRAATDTEIEVTVEGKTHLARVTKQREMDTSGEFAFRLTVVELGTNRRGKAVTSCVVEAASDQAPGGASGIRRRMTGHTKRAFDVLADLLAETGQTGHVGTPSGFSSVPEKWWRERFYERAMPGADQDTKKRTFRRAADGLISMHAVGMNNGKIWITRPTDRDSVSKEPGQTGQNGTDTGTIGTE